ncbi:putative Ig domain-containing protein [Geoalkalibacter halelectricus]|uniref:Ig domain-containing protein n=1 Tax=Geoalkalibacter halelectricus TaxID=2847045 RepID=A0ABY5ZKJ9_9BACT|nr:putative Ig domain-containing protein [Geoalkalibacter halelectricus]MDO3379683.1 putative Ig domain-containing protein [Geoalkalibacter halelectricus]UWZ78502.1 putative Ig domain-containing protein [Geoalkalibacter halelectricus]
MRWIRRLGLSLLVFISLAGCGGGGSSEPQFTVVADPGPDLTVFVGTDVFLDGSASRGEALSYSWSIISPASAPAKISNADKPVAIFCAEQVGDFGVRLTVRQGSRSHSRTLNIKALYPSEQPNPENPPSAPGDPAPRYTTRMIRTDFGGPIGALQSTPGGGAVTVAEVSTDAQTSIARLSKFSADGDLVASMDFGENGFHRPVALLEISPQEYALVGIIAYHPEATFGDIFVAFADFSDTPAEKSFFKFPDLGEAFLSSAALTPNGEIVVAGTTADDGRMLFAKIDRGGVSIFEWEGAAPSVGRAALPTSDGNLLVLGHLAGTPLDIFLALLDPQGNILWDHSFGGDGDEHPLTAKATDIGFLVVGSTNSPAKAEGQSDYDIFFLEVDSNGDLDWDEAVFLGARGMHEFPTALLKLSDTEFVIAGAAQVENKGFDAYLAWINLSEPDTPLVRQRTYGGSRDDLALSIAPRPDDLGFHVSGLADGDMSFEHPRSYGISGTAWLAEMTETGNVRPSSVPIPDLNRESGMFLLLNLAPFFYDINGDKLSFSATGLPGGINYDSDGLLFGTLPQVETTTPYVITVTATDDEGLDAEETFTLNVHPRND